MLRETKELRVTVVDRDITLLQNAPGTSEDDIIIVTPDQVDLLIDWLKEAKEEAEKNESPNLD